MCSSDLTYLAMNSLLERTKGYPLVVDTRVDSSGEAMMKDLMDGVIDVGVLWGPMAGYHAQRSGADLSIVPLTKDTAGPRLTYRIAMGVRAADAEWRRQLNRLVLDNQPEVNAILLRYGVPLLDDNERPIKPPSP